MMKTIGTAAAAFGAVMAGAGSAFAQTVSSARPLPTKAPEIDATAGVAAIAVLLAVSLIAREVYGRRARASDAQA